jgi:hypothetical protein
MGASTGAETWNVLQGLPPSQVLTQATGIASKEEE